MRHPARKLLLLAGGINKSRGLHQCATADRAKSVRFGCRWTLEGRHAGVDGEEWLAPDDRDPQWESDRDKLAAPIAN